MKIAHLSDTHLGYAGSGVLRPVAHPARPDLRIQQREADLMLGLSRAVDALVESVRPDLVIHTGDLFDGARPNALSIDFAMTQLKRLPEAGIPVVITEGVHSYPRDHSRGHALQLLAHISGVSVFCTDAGRIRVGDVLIHTFPYKAVASGGIPRREDIDPDAYNILAAHSVADGLHYFRGYRPAADMAIRACAPWYDYVALGHCHRFSQVPGTDRAFYSGATAMVTWGDLRPGHLFGFNVVELGNRPPFVKRELLETRPMHAYGLDDAQGLSAAEVLELLGRQAAEVPPDDANCEVMVHGMDPLARQELDQRDVEALFERAAGATYNIQARTVRWDATHAKIVEGEDPRARFAQLVEQSDGDEAFKDEVLTFGSQLLDIAIEQVIEDEVDTNRRAEVVGQ